MGDEHYSKNRELYNDYNSYRYSHYVKTLSKVKKSVFKSIPLLFHINVSSLPGFCGQQVPCGIKNYTLNDASINAVKIIEKNLNLDELEEPEEAVIEAIYLQEHFKTGGRTLWVVSELGLSEEQKVLLSKKIKAIEKWLHKNALYIDVVLCDEHSISSVYYESVYPGFHIDKRFFLDDFYVESILIAGKAPLWWLVGEEACVAENEKTVVDNDRFIQFETFNELRPEDYYSAAIWYLLNIDNAPVTTWLELSLLLYQITDIDKHETYATKLKILVQAGYFRVIDQEPKNIYAAYINNVINDVINDNIDYINNLFLQVINHYYHSGKKNKEGKSVFDFLYEIRAFEPGGIVSNGPGVEGYMSTLESMYNLAEDIFSRIKDVLLKVEDVEFESIQKLNPISERMLLKLRNSAQNSHILNNPKEGYFSQERVVIKYSPQGEEYKWTLAFPVSDRDTKEIKSFQSIVELLVWSVVNQVVNAGTQILADCSAEIISSMDMVNTVRLISDNINLDELEVSDLNVYVEKPVPVKSLVFVDRFGQPNKREYAQVHQLIIYNNGEFYTHQYNGYDEFIACVYNWFNLINHAQATRKPSIKIFAIKPGEAQELKSSMSGLLHELGSYFDENPISNTRTILKNNDRYYVSHITSEKVSTREFANLKTLYEYLERPLSHYTACIFTETFDQDAMLSYLLMQNKKDTMQLFYFIEGKNIRSFVFDENGALFTCEQVLSHRQSFINNWMVFLNNMKNKYEHDVPVEINQLIKLDDITYEHVPLTGEMLPTDSKYYTLELKVTNEDNKFDITFKSEGREFSSKEQGASLYSEISKHVSEKVNISKNMPVYISDIDVPHELLGGAKNRDTYLIDYLKYKRNIEKRLIDKINCYQ